MGAHVWNEALGKIEVEGGTSEQQATFYSALYRSLLFPRKFYEIDAENQKVYYSPYDGQIHKGVMFTDNGFWDTFRAVYAFLAIYDPALYAEILQGMVNAFNESGWLPHWSSPGHRSVMIGDHATSLFAEALAKGITNFDVEKAYTASKKEVTQSGPMPGLGREGVAAYDTLGFIPYPEYREATAKSLEYSYNDFCVAQIAKYLHKTDDYNYFTNRSMNYKNMYNPKTGFMQGRHSDGSWLTPFDPAEWGGPFTEGSSWHYTWSVFHDVQGLINLMGGKDNFTKKLDRVFTEPSDFKVGTYGQEIHEMTEMVLANMGQYAHGNQPIQHMIYLYAYAGESYKTEKWARTIMDSLYHSGPEGLCGDEDNGQTSVWYVLSALGIYPVCPATDQYILGSPLFGKATWHLPNGKTFIFQAENNQPENCYIKTRTLNGKTYKYSWITYQELISGGELKIKMSTFPELQNATEDVKKPFSLTIN